MPRLHHPLRLLFAVGLISAGGARAADFFVSPAGSDAQPGTAASPFATLGRARAAIREVKAAGRTAEPCTVWLRGGDYPVAESFVLTAADSGSAAAPVTYRNVAGEIVRLRGGTPLAAGAFRPVRDPATLARLAPAARGQILELDLASTSLRHTRRYPDVFTDTGGLLEIYFNDRRLPLARFPDEGYLTMRRVLANAGGGRDANWANPTPAPLPADGRGGTFEYREEFSAEHARWQQALAHGVWLKGYWRIPWQNEALRVHAIDPLNHTVTFAKPVPGGIGSKYHRPAGSGQEQYWLLNLLEAVDRPGEWCVDFADQKLYLYPPAGFATGQLVAADNADPLVRLEGASHITLRGLQVAGGLGHGIAVKGGESNLVVGCTVRDVARYGVVFDGGKNHELRSSDLFQLGAGGVWLGGGDEQSSPRVPAGHRVINCHIHDFALVERVYAPGVNAGFTGGGGGGHHVAVGMTVAHNLIHDTPHAGILHGSWDSVFEFNEILEFCQVSNDMGGIYCYEKYQQSGNQTFRYNYIHRSAEGDGLYFDHDHRDMHVYGNIIALDSRGKRGTGFLYKIGAQAKGHPQSIDCTNNIAINCRWGFEFVSAQASHIANNVAVNCATPFAWTRIDGTKSVKGDASFASGKNLAYAEDPGFVNLAAGDLRLRSDSRIFRDLPGFTAIPFEKIGLFVDEFRPRLPSDAAASRTRAGRANTALGIEIEDRR